jgi:hypothetical protein
MVSLDKVVDRCIFISRAFSTTRTRAGNQQLGRLMGSRVAVPLQLSNLKQSQCLVDTVHQLKLPRLPTLFEPV